MPRKKKERGRPARPLPPRIDATPEEIAEAVFRVKPQRKFDAEPTRTEYYCGECKRLVAYPETLYRDGLCEACHTAAIHAGP